VKELRLEICIPPQGNSVAMQSPDLCDDSYSGVPAEHNGALKELVIQTTN